MGKIADRVALTRSVVWIPAVVSLVAGSGSSPRCERKSLRQPLLGMSRLEGHLGTPLSWAENDITGLPAWFTFR